MTYRDRSTVEMSDMPDVIFLAKDYEDIKDRIIAAVEFNNYTSHLNSPIFALHNFTEVWQCWHETGLNHLVLHNGGAHWSEPQPHFIYFLMWAHIIKYDEDIAEDTSGKGLSRELFVDLTARFAKHMYGLDDDMVDVMKI